MSEHLYYDRQTILKEVGTEGQKKLKQKKVLIVGAGGLGHPSAIYLAASGIGEIGIIDFDQVEYSNLNRQIKFTVDDLGKDKATVLAEKIKNQNPYIHVYPIVKKLLPENIMEIFRSFDMILDCSDNLSCKFALHDFSWFLGKDLIQASIHQYEGQLQCFNYAKKRNSGCLRCLWQEIPDNHCIQNCRDAGVIGAVAGILGSFQSFEAIKMILGLGEEHINKTVMINLLNLKIQKAGWKKNNQCRLCSGETSLEDILKMHASRRKSYEKERLDHPGFILVDIRENHEKNNDAFSGRHGLLSLPLSEYRDWKEKINIDKNYLFICQKGIRSEELVKKLREKNQGNYFSLFGGIDNVSNTQL
ncbi:MAG: HesA/MoeB/ThiF family protein [Halobacteriovoraceae bacterium]|nr:HesA/MoeB/ThiF family protein [Halobacteriovoraceae bacterium]